MRNDSCGRRLKQNETRHGIITIVAVCYKFKFVSAGGSIWYGDVSAVTDELPVKKPLRKVRIMRCIVCANGICTLRYVIIKSCLWHEHILALWRRNYLRGRC